MKLDEHLSPAQISSIAKADARVNLWTGAIRSSKTIASLVAWLIFVSHAPKSGALVIVGRTRESIGRNIFVPLTDPSLFGLLAQHVRYNTGAPTATILGRTVHILGASDARAEMVLRGLTVAGAYVDEATLVSEPFWTQLLGRMSVPGAKLYATTNPDSPGHWLKKQVVDRAAELGYRVFRFRLSDNPYLDPKYVDQISREYVGLWYRRFILGEWVQAAGAIYGMWDPERHVRPPASFPPMERILSCGVDYGDTHFTRGYLVGLANRKLYVLSEWAPGSMTIGGHAADLTRWLAAQPPEWQQPDWIAVDPAAGSFRHQLFHDGATNVRNAHNSVLPGIRTLAALLATDALVVADTCVQLIERLPGYAWDPKATLRGVDAPIKENDDEVDALRYAVYTARLDWREHIPLAPALPNAPGEDTQEAA